MADALSFTAAVVARMRAASWDAAMLVPRPPASLLAVRARHDALGRVAAALGLDALPAPNEARSCALGDCLWLRPDEWLVAGPEASRASGLATLEAAVEGDDGAVVDVSASRVTMEMSGSAAREVLASCCALDLHPRAFPAGRCAQSMVARAPVLLQLVADGPAWRLYVRPSLVAYVVAWLADGMEGVRAESG